MVLRPSLDIKKWRLFIVGLLCLNLIIAAISYQQLFHSSKTSEQHEEVFPYDSRLESLPQQIVGVLGKEWQLLVVVFINPDNPISRLRYLDTVYQRHSRSGLSVVGVCGSRPQQAESVKQQLALSFPLIPDIGESIHRFLRCSMRRFHDGIVIIDSDLRVKFTDVAVPNEDSLRILVEKYLLKRVDYSYHRFSAGDFFRVDGRLPTMQLRNIRTEAEIPLGVHGFGGKTLVVYFAGCAPCRLQEYLSNLARLEKRAPESGALTAIFPANFATQDLLSHAQRLDIQSSMFVMAGGSDPADEYVTRYGNELNEPFLVTVGKTGLITRIAPLEDDAQ